MAIIKRRKASIKTQVPDPRTLRDGAHAERLGVSPGEPRCPHASRRRDRRRRPRETQPGETPRCAGAGDRRQVRGRRRPGARRARRRRLARSSPTPLYKNVEFADAAAVYAQRRRAAEGAAADARPRPGLRQARAPCTPASCRRTTTCRPCKALRDRKITQLRDGARAAHLARPVDGRAVLAGGDRRLQGGADRRQHARPIPADADHRRRHDPPGAGARHRRRRRRPAGDRDRASASARWSRPTTCAARPATRSSRSAPSSSRPASPPRAPAATRASSPPRRRPSSRRCSTARIAVADAVITTAGVPGRPAPRIISRAAVERMKAGAVIVDIARRERRQLRADARRRDRAARRREDRRPGQPAGAARLPRERDVRAQPVQPPEARHQEGRAQHRLERRGVRRHRAHARRARSSTNRRASCSRDG